MPSTHRREKNQRARRLTAITAIVSLFTGALAVGITAQVASAATWAPTVSVENIDPASAGKDFVLAGEDVEFDVDVSNTTGGAQFNLSLVATLPATVSFVDGGAFGTPVVYKAGDVLPNRSRTSTATDCVALGLVQAPGQPTLCAVPAGQQVWVWSNVNDLPQGGTVSSSVKVHPIDDLYPVGSEISFSIKAFTSSDPARLPTYDGSPSVSRTTDHTSGAGTDSDDVPVRALRIIKSEPSPEGELLRGVHDDVTTYTLKVDNTTRGASTGVTVTDYLPAGLEYLGLGAGDNSTGDEYDTSGSLSGGAISGETVETVQLTGTQAAALGLPGAGVYTKIVWTLGTLSAGKSTTLTYRAAVPLFENALWATGTAPTPQSGDQAANLDNNTGPSTRQGGTDTPQAGQVMRNVAAVAGSYQGAVLGGNAALRAAADDDDAVIEALDVRVVKSVDTGGLFDTGEVATYSVKVDVSEYVDARGIVLTDVIPNGLCPAFPVEPTGVALMIGDLEVSQDAWNAQVPGDACNFPTEANGAVLSDGLHIASIKYTPADGTFTVVFEVDDRAAGSTFTGQYSVMQRPNYTGAGGGTSSGDRFVNNVTITAQTDPIAAIADDPELADRVGGTLQTLDDSSATITSQFTGLSKTVLERGGSVDDPTATWVKEATTPFSPGDDVWYRVRVPFATGIDTRNPILTDYLPEGVEIAEIRYAYTGLTGTDVTTPVAYGTGSFPTAYIPNIAAAGTSLTWEFGSRNRGASADRFMPAGSTVTVYIRAVVQSQSASRDDVDSPLNQAKYQQVNVDGELSFLRDDAGIDLDWGATLTKGIRAVGTDLIGTAFGNRVATRQVVQGDEVEYRIDVKAPQNTTTEYVVWDVLPAGVTKADVGSFTAEIYDGGTTSALTGSAVDFAKYDAGDTLPGGVALSSAYAGRSVVAFTVHATVPGTTAAFGTAPDVTPEVVRGLSLGYTLTVPAGIAGGGAAAQLTQSYTNTAGIVSYDVDNAGPDDTTVVPQREAGAQQLTTRTPRDGEVAASDVDTVDTAEVHLPDLGVTKKLVSTEVGPTTTGSPFGENDVTDGTRNTAGQIVQGERATFEYTVKVPAHTTVKGAVLSDNRYLALANGTRVNYQYVAGSAKYFQGATGTTPVVLGTAATDFRGSDATGTGVLTFPDTYTNSTDAEQVFRVQITVWMKDRDNATANAGATQIGNNASLANTATLSFLDPNAAGQRQTRTGTASTTFVEPSPTLTKTPSTTTVSANGTVTYRLVASNASGRPALYDSTVLDCVPAEITPTDAQATAGTATILAERCAIGAGNTIQRGTGTGTLIEWKIPMITGTGTTGAPALTYTGTVETKAGGGSAFTNYAQLTGYTLPLAVGSDTDTSARRGTYTRAANATVKMPEASLDKTVSPGSAAVGDIVTYTLKTSLPASTNFYDARLTDLLPEGVEFVAGGAHTETVDWAGDPSAPTIGAPALDGRTLSWAIDDQDVLAWNLPRSITVTFQARLTDGVRVTAPTNTGTFAWSAVDDSTVQGDQRTNTHSVDVTILNPKVSIAKSVKPAAAADSTYASSAAGDPDQAFDFRVRVSNSTAPGTSPAYGIVVTDTVPAGIRIDTAQAVFAAGVEFSDETALQEGRGGVITWTLAGPLSNVDGSATTDLVYRGTFVDAEALGTDALTNRVAVTQYESATTGGWVYRPGAGTIPGGAPLTLDGTTASASVTPRFPHLDLAKKVTAGTEAFIGESFSWTLQARNTGDGAAQTVTLTDTLPRNWEFDAAVAPTVSIGGQAATPLTGVVLGTDGDRQTVTWTIGSPTGSALLPGTVGSTSDDQRTVLVTFSAVPLAGAATDAGAGLEFDHRNTLAGVVTDRTGATANATGDYTGDDATADAHIARSDLKVVKTAIGGTAQGAWTAGDAARAGYTQPQWRITVANQGPDAAYGPFTVVDTTDLPAGVTTGAFTARYHSSAADTTGTVLTVTGTGTEDDPFVVGGRTLSLKADGSDSIVLLADVTISATATGTAKNTATVTGRTFERDEDIADDNTSEVSKPIAAEADLSLTKTVNTTEPTAGRPITWSIQVRNAGPSVSVSNASDRITVTDTIPDGIIDVQDPSAGLTAWTVAASDGWPASAGDTITWTYTGTALAVGPAQALTLTGTIESSWTGGDIVNTAAVEPGATSDPDPADNEGEATATPEDDTTLAIAKTRVVRDGGVWKDASQLGASLPDVVAGETVSYRVVVTNNGPADARDVTVVDEVPAMLSYSSVEDENGTWTRTAGPDTDDTFTVAGTVPAAAGSNTRSFIVTYTIDSRLAPDSVIENWATASAENSTNTPRDGDTTDSDRIADLSIVKKALDADGAPVADGVIPGITAGTETRFLLTVTNNGPSISGGPIKISDRLPAGLTYVSSTVDVAASGAVEAEPEVTDAGRSIEWSVLSTEESLAAGETIVIEVTAFVAADVRPQRLVNAADVDGPVDFDTTNDHSEALVDVVTLAEMSITKDVADGPWIAGTEVTYTLTVHNGGPSVADASVADLLPIGLTPVSIDGEGWTCDQAAESCLRSAHPLGDSTITVVALIDANVPTGTELTNTATLTWTDSRTTSPHETSDDATIGVTTDADLRLTKTAIDADGAEIDAAVAGESVRYRLEVENLGTSDAIGPITVVDSLPEGTSFAALVGEAATTWTAEVDENDPRTVTFTLVPADAALASGVAAPAIVFDVLVASDVETGAVLENSAVVSSGTPDSNPANDSDVADVTVAREVDLAITKTHDPAAVRIGDELPFTIEVRNAGPSIATGVVVTDVVPAGLEVAVADAIGDDWTIVSVEPVDPEDPNAGTRVVAGYGPALAPGETAAPLVIGTRVLVSAYAEVVNVATVTATEITEEHPDRTPADNTASDPVTVPPMAALVVTKTAVGAFQVGKTGEYEIVVRNDGPTADPGPITVTDALPEGQTFASSPDEGVQADGRVVTWTIDGGLEVDESVTLTLRVNVGEAAFPSVTNVVTVESPTEQTDQGQPTDDETVTVKAADPLATTGGELAWGLIVMALLMLTSGALFAASRRRRGDVVAG